MRTILDTRNENNNIFSQEGFGIEWYKRNNNTKKHRSNWWKDICAFYGYDYDSYCEYGNDAYQVNNRKNKYK